MRDSVMKANIPGAKEGMYMATDTLMTDVRPLNIQGEYALEARGLWRMEASLYTLRFPGDKQTGAEIPLGVKKEQVQTADQEK